MTICIAGKNNIAIDVCNYILENYSQYNICVVTNITDKGVDGFQRSFLRYAIDKKLKIIDLNDVYEIDDLILVSLEFDRLIYPSKCKKARLYNIHFSLLPEYKGQFTSALPILHGKEYTGVTFHEIERGVDTGDIIAQKKIMIDNHETAHSLYHKYIKEGTEIVISNIESVINNTYNTYPQSVLGSTFFSINSIDYSNLNINLKCTAYQIQLQIRAFHFREYQLPVVFGKKIIAVELTETKSQQRAGQIIRETEESITISTIDYDVILIKDRLDELVQTVRKGDYKKLTAYKYLQHYLNEKETTHGWTLLMVAAYNNYLDIVKYLVNLGANVNEVNYKGTSVLMYAKDCAIIHNDKRIFSYLLNHGANIVHKDYNGLSIKDYISEYKSMFPEI